MTFIEACGSIYMRELQKDHDREIAEDRYMPQQAFSSCMGRGKAMSHNATTAVDNFRALCILLHREKTTDERYEDEKTALMVAMPVEDVEIAESRSWWLD
jgi:hypothetical protein